jgi:hypothetical protein
VLRSDTRRAILDAAFSTGSAADALSHLRAAMRIHTFPTTTVPCNLRRLVDKFEARSRREGLHVLEGWDYQAHKFPADIVPVLMLDYFTRLGIPGNAEKTALAILLDQYFLSILALLAVRGWDDGDANANLDRVTSLLQDLHGPNGGGLRVVENADTLLLLAIAYYNPEETSFGLLMRKVRKLDEWHQSRLALPFAGILGSHLRWGFRFMYSRDVGAMRDDNVVDYPMLQFAIATLLRAYSRICDEGILGAERETVVGGLLNGFAADPWAFTGSMPMSLADDRAEYDECRDRLSRYRIELLEDIERQQPTREVYSPLGFSCSFLSNAAVAVVGIAMENANVRQQPSLNALFSSDRAGASPEESAEGLAERLMQFSTVNPERLGWGGAPLIVHDPRDAAHWFNTVRRTL